MMRRIGIAAVLFVLFLPVIYSLDISKLPEAPPLPSIGSGSSASASASQTAAQDAAKSLELTPVAEPQPHAIVGVTGNADVGAIAASLEKKLDTLISKNEEAVNKVSALESRLNAMEGTAKEFLSPKPNLFYYIIISAGIIIFLLSIYLTIKVHAISKSIQGPSSIKSSTQAPKSSGSSIDYLKGFIQTQLRRGYNYNAIAPQLERAGWKREQIYSAFSQIQGRV